jgi:hypothetical protein
MIVVGSHDSELVMVPTTGTLVYDTGALVMVVDSVVGDAADSVVF